MKTIPAGIFFNLFMDTKSDEIFNIFNSGNNGGIILNDLNRNDHPFAEKYINGINGINGN
jgi:hypothetical protein